MAYQYEIYVPVTDNAGTRYPESVLQEFKEKLIENFGGITDTRYKCKGIWRYGSYEYHDEIVIWKVLSLSEMPSNWSMKRFKTEMQRKLRQDKILITCTLVQVI